MSSHPTLGKGDQILRRYGTIRYTPDLLLKNVVLDASGINPIDDINAHLLSLRSSNAVEDYNNTVKYIFDKYKDQVFLSS
jgi:hypothetical protein